jgi:hypothetical protein
MYVEDARHQTPLREAFLRAGEWMGFSVGDGDQNAERQEGFAPFQYNIHNGKALSQKLHIVLFDIEIL